MLPRAQTSVPTVHDGNGSNPAISGYNQRVRVFTRVRPPLLVEGNLQPVVEVEEATNIVRICNRAGEECAQEFREFTFDGVFPACTPQERIFKEVGQPFLKECLKGINGTIFAYGQMGSGKTHSLLCRGERAGMHVSTDTGLLTRLVIGLFAQTVQDDEARYDVEVAALQVYSEQADDLLHPHHRVGGGHNLAVQDGGFTPGLSWLRCGSAEQALHVLDQACGNLFYAETNMNRASSRSHAIFQLRVTRRQLEPTGSAATRARICVVDLAGSERVKKSGVKGKHFQEAMAINRSLLALGNVINALAAKRSHVPFRNSKLTRILDGSIGGKCRTALLVCVSPDAVHMLETICSLEFAARAMCIEGDSKVNRSGSVRQGSSPRVERDLKHSLKRVQEKVARLEQSLGAAEGEAADLQQALVHAEVRAEQFQALAEARSEEAQHESCRARHAEECAFAAAASLQTVRQDSAEQKRALEAHLSLLQTEMNSMRLEWAVRTAVQQDDCHARVRCNRLHGPMHWQKP